MNSMRRVMFFDDASRLWKYWGAYSTLDAGRKALALARSLGLRAYMLNVNPRIVATKEAS